MKTLLINSHVSENEIGSGNDATPPMGYGYISRELKKFGYDVELLDAYLNDLTYEHTLSSINSCAADFNLINIFSSNFKLVCKIIKNSAPRNKWLLGGVPARFLHDHLKEILAANNVHTVIGEAEFYIPHYLAGQFVNGYSSKVITITDEYFPRKLNATPDRSIFTNNFKEYHELGLTEASIITSRGCPYDCAFCCAARSINPGIPPRFVPIETLEADIAQLESFGVPFNSIRILDDLFLRTNTQIKIAEQLFSKRKLKWRSMAHIDPLSRFTTRDFDSLRASGCLELFVGIESGSDSMLRILNKKSSREKIIATLGHAFRSGINVKGYFIVGLPGETASQAFETMSLISILKSDANQNNVAFRSSVFKYRPYHGTALYNEITKKYGPPVETTPDQNLVTTGKRASYNLTSGNYSDMSNEDLNTLIKSIQDESSLPPSPGSR